MGILDDAIREHLDLKRKHGARDAELREIEDEAFGAGDQPDPFAAGGELFNEVSEQGSAPAETVTAPPPGLGDLGEPDIGGEEPTRLVEPEGLQEEPSADEPAALEDEPIVPPDDLEQIPGQTELPGQDEIPGQERLDDPLEGYEPVPEAASELPAEAEPPVTSDSLEDLIAEEEPFPEDVSAPDTLEEQGPSADRGGALEELEPEPPAVPDPPPPPPDSGPEPPGRARGRIDVPTQEHPPPGETGDLPPLPSEEVEERDEVEEPPLESEAPELYDFETDEGPLSTSDGGTDDDFEALGPAEEEAPYLEEEEPYAEESPSGSELPPTDTDTAVRPALEDEEAYEGGGLDPEEGYEEAEDDLWFEKGPPKDFDFDE